jgi:hypothetical protein
MIIVFLDDGRVFQLKVYIKKEYSKMSRNPLKKRLDFEITKDMISNFLGTRRFTHKTLYMVLALILLAAYIPEILNYIFLLIHSFLHKIFYFEISERIFILSVTSIITLIIILLLYISGRKAFKERGKIEVESQESEKTKNLVILLSSIRKIGAKNKQEAEKHKTELIELKKRINSQNSPDKNNFINLIDQTNWKMPYLAVKHHHPNLNKVYVITSHKDGSSQEFELFKQLFEYIFEKNNLIEEKISGGINFEDIKKVFDEIENIFQEPGFLKKKKSSLLIDITGGQKTTSIAAAVATLSMGRKFQYISTTDFKVKTYDVGYFPED